MDVEIVAGGASLPPSANDNITNDIKTETGVDPDTLPTGKGSITYAIPTVTGVYSGAIPSGTDNVFVTLAPPAEAVSSAVRNFSLSAWAGVFCVLQLIALIAANVIG